MIRQRLRLGMLVSVSALWATAAHAAPGDATRLEYARSEVAKHCPDRDALRSAVTRRLGYDPFFPVARQTIVVEITNVDGGLRAQMHLVDEQGMIIGSRELRDRTDQCDELVASLALAISIALDPSAALGVEPADGSSDSNRPVAPVQAAGEDAASVPSDLGEENATVTPPPQVSEPRATSAAGKARATSMPITVRAAAFGALGVAPARAVGVRAGLGVRREWFQLVAEFVDQFPAERTANGGSVRAALYAGSLAPCVAKSWLAACALLNVGVLHSEGRGIPYPATNRSLYAALGARLEATPQLVGHLRLLLNADALRALTPITLRLHGEEVWKTPFVSLALGVGLALQFP
ncbi:MAG: hypothetical protein ABIQ16_09305 [Polyangiaceae bacterium]